MAAVVWLLAAVVIDGISPPAPAAAEADAPPIDAQPVGAPSDAGGDDEERLPIAGGHVAIPDTPLASRRGHTCRGDDCAPPPSPQRDRLLRPPRATTA
ncbi:MAG: hypothetical protein FJ191_13835 [Gammaproteobacteria bacterium]|nr:hypothetical protein [Gammaproteobacteria bacterium]